MKNTLFISDLHLGPECRELIRLFIDFTRLCGGNTRRLYILGDLFEVWFGDDAANDLGDSVGQALRALSNQGIDIAIMHGNRDFLLGSTFASQAGCRLIDDPTRIELNGKAVLLSHGDILCIDDVDYQKFRRQVRDPEFQQHFLSLPIDERRQQAAAYREQSRLATSMKAAEIMDVNADAVTRFMRDHDADILVHGHTHRPAVHPATEEHGQRIVLGDWGPGGSVLIHDQRGFELYSFTAATLDSLTQRLNGNYSGSQSPAQ